MTYSRIFFSCLIIFFVLTFFVNLHVADSSVTKYINYQAKLLDSSGNPVADASYDVRFRIYSNSSDCDSDSGSNLLWTENRTGGDQVTTSSGLFSVLLGSVSSFTDSAMNYYNGANYFLGVKIGTDSQMTPCKRVVGTLYSLNSDRLDGADTSATGGTTTYVPITNTYGNLTITGTPQGSGVSDGSVYINPGSATSDYTIFGVAVNGTSKLRADAEGDIFANTFNAGNTLILSDSSIIDTNGDLNFMADNDATNYLTLSSDATDLTLATTDAADFFIKPSGDQLVFQNAVDSVSGYQFLDADGGTVVLGIDTTNEVLNIGGTGAGNSKMYIATEDAKSYGIYITSVTSGSDYFSNNIYSTTDYASGYAGYFYNSAVTAGTAIYAGSDNGIAVRGYSAGATSASLYGRQVGSSSGFGVYGITEAAFGNPSNTGYGVYGIATAASGKNFGVYGISNSSTGYAGWFGGSSFGLYAKNAQFGAESSTSGRVVEVTMPASGYSRGVYSYTNVNSTYAVYADSDAATTAYSVFGVAGATSSYGGYFRNTTAGTALYGDANVGTGESTGIFGNAASTTGRGVYGYASSSTGANFGIYGVTESSSGLGVYGWAKNGSSGIGVKGVNSSSGPGVYGSSTLGTGVYGLSDSSSNYYAGVKGVQSNTSNIVTYGVYGLDSAQAGAGVYGVNDSGTGNTAGVYGVSASSTGTGLWAIASSATGANYGVYAQSDSTSGTAVRANSTGTSGTTYGVRSSVLSAAGYSGYFTSTGYGVYSQASLASGYGMYALGSGDGSTGLYSLASSTGTTYGIYSEAVSGSGTAIYGIASAANGTTYAIRAVNNSATGYSGYFTNTSGYGVFSSSGLASGYGVYGESTGATGKALLGVASGSTATALYGDATGTTGINFGVHGNTESATGWAGYFTGGAGVYSQNGFTTGATLTLTDSAIKETGDMNLQANNDTDDYIYLKTNVNTPAILFESSVLSYTYDPGFRINTSTGKLEYRDEDSSTWVNFDSLAVGGTNYWATDGVNSVYPATITDNVGIGAAPNDNYTLDITTLSSDSRSINVSGSASTAGVYIINDAASSRGLYAATTDATSTTYGVVGRADGVLSGANYGGWFNAAGTTGMGVYGNASSSSGANFGVYGQSASTVGTGIYGIAAGTTTASFGVYGANASTSGFALYGLNTALGGYGVYGAQTGASGTTYGVFGSSSSTTGRGVYGIAGGTTSVSYGVYGASGSSSGFGVYGINSNSGFGVYGVSANASGVYGSTSVGYGVLGSATSSGIGVYGLNSSTGYGVYGYNTSASGAVFGIYGLTISPAGTAVYGRASIGSSGTSFGGQFLSASTTGIGVYGSATGSGATTGAYGISSSSSGYGVYGIQSSSTGTTFGIYAQNASISGYGVYGNATNSGSGTSYGGYFQSASTTGRGLYAVASGSGANMGVYGLTTAASGYALYGVATDTTDTNYAGYFQAAGSSARGVYSYVSNTADTNYAGYFVSAGSTGYGVYSNQTSSSGISYGMYSVMSGSYTLVNYAGYFETNADNGRGVYAVTTSTAGTTLGVVGRADGALTGTNYGGYFSAAGSTGRGVYGYASGSAGFGVYAQVDSTDGEAYGVYSFASGARTGVNYSGYFETAATQGRGLYAITTSSSDITYAVTGIADGASTGVNYGGYFRADGDQGVGVSGVTTGTSSSAFGVYGAATTTGASGAGVYGFTDETVAYGGKFINSSTGGNDNAALYANSSGTGVIMQFAIEGIAAATGVGPSGTQVAGVYGYASASSGVNYGVFGATNSTSGYAGYFYGGMGVFTTGSYYIKDDDSTNDTYIAYDATNGYMQFFADGTEQMRINRGAAGTIDGNNAFQSSQFDYAEYFPTDDPSLKEGELVSMSLIASEKVIKSEKANDLNLVGIISTKPGFVTGNSFIGENTGALVALAGRVPTLVSTENGPILRGDFLTSSSIPGVAMKATEAGMVVGKAMEDYSVPDQVGTITVFVNLQWFGGAVSGGGDIALSQDIQIFDKGVKVNSLSEMAGLNLTGDLNLNNNYILNVGKIAGINGSWQIDERGVFAVNINTTEGNKEMYSMQSSQVEFSLSGTANLINGQAEVVLDKAFSEIISQTTPYKVILTPNGNSSGLFVESKSSDKFAVKELGSGSANISFDWLVIGVRKGYEKACGDGLDNDNDSLTDYPADLDCTSYSADSEESVVLPVDLAPLDQAPVDQAPVDPVPEDPAPVDPAPVDPAPVDPAPVDPAPVDPAPEDPAPVDPAPVDPAPVDPAPVDSAPIDPAPVN